MANNKPDLIVHTVTGTNENPFWTRIGAAWKNSKGCFSIKLNALPINGELVLLPPREDKEPEDKS